MPTREFKEKTAALDDRGVVWLRGPDAEKLLAGLITNSIELKDDRTAVHAGLLSPQGKILFDFLVARLPDGYVLDVARDRIADLIKRLTMYKLRADVAITDASDQYKVLAVWGSYACSSGETRDTVAFRDPRHPDLGLRILADAKFATDIASATNGSKADATEYHAYRVALGVPEGGKDYAFGDTYPHEANFDLLHGVSFTKGCYVGQEVVSRMQNKAVVRKRVVRVEGSSDLATGADVMLGDVSIGRVGTVDGRRALALLRLDRAAEADDKGIALRSGEAAITVDARALADYRAAAAARPNAPAFS